MYTSDNNTQKIYRLIFVYLSISLFLAFFGAVYEHFSYGVYSNFMIYAFVFPLALGALPLLLIAVLKKRIPSEFSLKNWNLGIAALSVGSVVKGVLDIYGTTNQLIVVYPALGAILLFVGAFTYLKK